MDMISLIFFIPVIFLLVVGVTVFVRYRKEILSFLFPDKWVEIEMLELDNNTINWLQKKTKDLKFTFNDGEYNMFSQEIKEEIQQDGSKITKIQKNPPIYRAGRLAKFFYNEGNEDPLDFRTGKMSGNPQINKQISNIDISRLWTGHKSMSQEFLEKYGIFVLLGIGVILLIMMFQN